jgi:hypothetical protein
VRPMNFSRLIREFLWIFPLLVQAAILFVLLSRKLLARFPFFSAYTVAVLSRECLLLFLVYPSKLYAVIYWYGEVCAIALGLGSIFETIRHLCAPYAFVRIAFRLVRILIVVFSLLAILISLHASDRTFAVILSAERSARLVQACLLILVIFVVLQLGSTWSDYSVGIAAGFGTYSALSLAIFELSRLHLVSVPVFITFNSAAYNVAAVIWGIYFLRPSRGWRSARLPKPNLTPWKEALTAYTQQWYRQ